MDRARTGVADNVYQVIFQLLLEWLRIKVVLGFNIFTATRNNPHYVCVLVDCFDHPQQGGKEPETVLDPSVEVTGRAFGA